MKAHLRMPSPKSRPDDLRPFASLAALVAANNSASADDRAIAFFVGDQFFVHAIMHPLQGTPPRKDLPMRTAFSQSPLHNFAIQRAASFANYGMLGRPHLRKLHLATTARYLVASSSAIGSPRPLAIARLCFSL